MVYRIGIKNLAEKEVSKIHKFTDLFAWQEGQGSMTELQNLLLIARDVGYISQEVFSKLAKQSVVANKLLTGLLKATRLKSYES